jgi:hypothetical protein
MLNKSSQKRFKSPGLSLHKKGYCCQILRKWFEKECWQSTKYRLDQMDPQEVKRTWLPELGMTLGAAISALKQSWTAFKLNKDRGEPGRVWYYAETINRVQDALGLEMTQFDL